MRVLLGCVNSSVSLVGYDLAARRPFWYCPANVLRVCGVCVHAGSLWVASDNALNRLNGRGAQVLPLPGPHDNLAHSVRTLAMPGAGDGAPGGTAGFVGVADTGNSRILVCSPDAAAGALTEAGSGPARQTPLFPLALSPLEGWLDTAPDSSAPGRHGHAPGSGAWRALPQDAIHLNDFVPWHDGLLASAFSYQPFAAWKQSSVPWQREGLGCLFSLRRREGRTLARVVASGLDCPHSLQLHNGDVYCCSSSAGAFFRYVEDKGGLLREAQRWPVTQSHFLRGALRVEEGWLLGGSSRRHVADGGGMCLFLLHDGQPDGRGTARVEQLHLGGPGEIYDIIPWDAALMPAVCAMLLEQPALDLPGEFPPRCALPAEYRG